MKHDSRFLIAWALASLAIGVPSIAIIVLVFGR